MKHERNFLSVFFDAEDPDSDIELSRSRAVRIGSFRLDLERNDHIIDERRQSNGTCFHDEWSAARRNSRGDSEAYNKLGDGRFCRACCKSQLSFYRFRRNW